MRVCWIAIATGLSLALVAGCTDSGRKAVPSPTTPAPEQVPQSVMQELIKPKGEYLGIYVEKDAPVTDQFAGFRKALKKRPNLVKSYSAWDSPYNVDWAKSVWAAKALPQLEWEPHDQKLKDIASGADDEYLTGFARDVKRSGVPVVISFAHEFNGDWYDWGTKKTKAAHFVASWKRIHGIFKQEGVTNAIWMWSPNVIAPAMHVKLKPYYPGDAYVDWVGVIGYYREEPHTTFELLFDPTIKQVSTFTRKPVLIAETGARPGARRVNDVTDLLVGVAKRPNVIGLIWFNLHKKGKNETDWRIETSKPSLQTFVKYLNRYPYGAK